MKTIIASVAAVVATAYAKEKVQRIALKQTW